MMGLNVMWIFQTVILCKLPVYWALNEVNFLTTFQHEMKSDMTFTGGVTEVLRVDSQGLWNSCRRKVMLRKVLVRLDVPHPLLVVVFVCDT